MENNLIIVHQLETVKTDFINQRKAIIDKEAKRIELLLAYEELLMFYKSESTVNALLELKSFVLEHGIPEDAIHSGNTSLRTKIWKLFLSVPVHYDLDQYVKFVEIDPSEMDEMHAEYINKIQNDAFRTFKMDNEFWNRVEKDTMHRVLKATSIDAGYVQGMNVILGPFLFIMAELDSYYCFHTLVTQHIPSYVSKNLEGVHRGTDLTSRCLKILDPYLHQHLISKYNNLSIFSVKYIISLMANVQPLKEVIKLWDAIFAFGVHFNILLFCAYLINVRKLILAESGLYKINCIIEQNSLDSELLIKMAVAMVPHIPADLFDELVTHGNMAP